MTFTYAGTLASDREKVRFYTGDTVSPGYLSDEAIAVLLVDEGGVGGAVVAALQSIAAQLARPDFKADWLQVSNAEARKGILAQLAEMRRKFGQSAITASVVNVYRADSLATEEPDYSDGAASSGEDED